MRGFEKGREYERKRHDAFFHKFLGWTCLILAPIYYFFSIWDFSNRVYTWAGLTLFGCFTLLLYYSEIKELKQWTA